MRQIADEFGRPFEYFSGPYDEPEGFLALLDKYQPDFVALSGWIKPVMGIEPKKMFNIHPGLLNPGGPKHFGGKGMYGHHVHEAVMAAFHRGEVTHSAVTMHFVTENYDEGPKFFEYPVWIRPNDTAETLAARVNKIEHSWQSFITNLVVSRQISLVEGRVVVPDWYKKEVFCPAELKAALSWWSSMKRMFFSHQN